MTRVWFTSDTHFGHRMLVDRRHRPFRSTEEMDERIIADWNARVSHEDRVFHLGDVGMSHRKEVNEIVHRLNGTIVLVSGNHDHRDIRKLKRWEAVHDLVEVKGLDTIPIVLCHYRMSVWNRSHHGALHLYGHSHGRWPGDSQCCDVGVDATQAVFGHWGPVSLDEARKMMRAFPTRVHVDYHRPKPIG